MIRNKKGFTLIELIIVMAIIGILAVVAVIAIGSKSADARDARRLADMATVRTAMALACSEGDDVTIADQNADTTVLICHATGNDYVTFTNLRDPSHQTACPANGTNTNACAATNASCDYAFASSNAGAVIADGTTTIDTCAYYVIFRQEGGDGLGYASADGLVE